MQADYKLLIFDWDGTLCDSIARIVEAMHAAAAASGYPLCSDEAVKGIIGLALPEAISVLYPQLDDVQVMAMRDHYANAYMALDATPSVLYPGVREALLGFREQGYRLAVATGKARRGLDRVLKAHGWEDFFDITRAADETRGKPHPLMLEQIMSHCEVGPERSLMVGDASFDLLMARNAGMHSVAVGYGALPLDVLRQYEPQMCIESFDQLPQWLNSRRAGARGLEQGVENV
ncbi:HAD-IIIA family hydrolase [Pseudomonas coleopterorum]|uniref:HAD-IIIA family hydrolase n=1 Tax=Pseudomonas coleopterorum TaxID=1605838 RepID=UPI002A6AB5C1|nr:HAD-IIIA family hydrolase [Pseudomonas coleopterorum]MDY1019306.1 HAD-IIIA family hydrolase [Pseudomonas coleopterorum]